LVNLALLLFSNFIPKRMQLFIYFFLTLVNKSWLVSPLTCSSQLSPTIELCTCAIIRYLFGGAKHHHVVSGKNPPHFWIF
jgi:hypothetical protein